MFLCEKVVDSRDEVLQQKKRFPPGTMGFDFLKKMFDTKKKKKNPKPRLNTHKKWISRQEVCFERCFERVNRSKCFDVKR